MSWELDLVCGLEGSTVHPHNRPPPIFVVSLDVLNTKEKDVNSEHLKNV